MRTIIGEDGTHINGAQAVDKTVERVVKMQTQSRRKENFEGMMNDVRAAVADRENPEALFNDFMNLWPHDLPEGIQTDKQ